MADCYIIRRGGNAENKPTNDILFSLDTMYINFGTIPPVNDVIVGGEIAEKVLVIDTLYPADEIYQNGEL